MSDTEPEETAPECPSCGSRWAPKVSERVALGRVIARHRCAHCGRTFPVTGPPPPEDPEKNASAVC